MLRFFFFFISHLLSSFLACEYYLLMRVLTAVLFAMFLVPAYHGNKDC